MNRSKITYTLIKKAVEKGIRDMQENPARGIRNLVELGERFASGRFQRGFFVSAQDRLSDENSAYYAITKELIENTDAEVLTTLGMNIGYNAWTYGAQYIRGIEDAGGFNVPWILQMCLRKEQLEEREREMIQQVVRQGCELGIYCYAFQLDRSCGALDYLLDILETEPDCAFLLFLHPSHISDLTAGRMRRMKTALPLIDIDYDNDELAGGAIERLRAQRLLYGGFTRCEHLDACAPAALSRAEELHILFLFFIRRQRKYPREQNDTEYGVENIRQKLTRPVFPFDYYYDIAYVDSVISEDPCIAFIQEDGTVLAICAGEKKIMSAGGAGEQPLRDIFRELLPKQAAEAN